MTLISLLIALVLERLRFIPEGWHIDKSARKLDAWLTSQESTQAARSHEVLGPLLLLIPALLLAVILLFGLGALATFFINLAILTLAFGCRNDRDALKRWYLAQERGDTEEQQEASDFIRRDNLSRALGEQLVWLNYRYYFAVIFWFLIFGAPGVLGYAVLRANEQKLPTLMGWVDWLPVRVAGLTFLFVGHFTRAMNEWLTSIGLVQNSQEVLIQLAKAAEDIPQTDEEEPEPQALLGLARRATIFLLAVTALASLFGWLI